MVEHFDFEKLPGAYQITRDLDVRLTRCRIAAGYLPFGISIKSRWILSRATKQL